MKTTELPKAIFLLIYTENDHFFYYVSSLWAVGNQADLRLFRGPDKKAILLLCACPGTDRARSVLGLRTGPGRVEVLLYGTLTSPLSEETWIISSQTTMRSICNAHEISSVPFVQHCLISFLLTLSHFTPTNCREDAVILNKLPWHKAELI